MSRLRWRKVWRDLWLHKPRASMVVLAIMVGVTGSGAILDKWSLLQRGTRDGYLATNPASATLRTERVDAALLARVRALPAVAAAQGRRTVVAGARVRGGWQTANLLTADDLGDLRIHTVEPLEGAWPPPAGTIAVEVSSRALAEVAVGDVLTVQVGAAPPRELVVSGVVRDSGLAPGWMEHVVYGFVAPATLTQLGAAAELDQLQIVVRDRSRGRSGARRVAAAVQALVEASGRRVASVDVPEPGRHVHAAQMDSLLLTQGALGLLSLLLSGFLVVNLVAAMVAGQVREIGVMKAVGGSPWQIAGMYLALAAVLGAAACAVAIPVAAGLGRAYARFSAEALNFALDARGIPPWVFVLQLAVGVLLPVAAAAIPVARGCRLPVAAALRDHGIDTASAGGAATGPLARASGGFSRPLLLSLRNAFRRRQRMVLTVVTLALAGAVFLGTLSLRAAIAGTFDHVYGTLVRFDGTVRLAEPRAASELERAAAGVPGVARAEAWGMVRAVTRGADGLLGNPLALSFVPPETAMLALPIDRGRWLRPGDRRALVVTRGAHAREDELAVGAVVTLVIGGRASRWTVVGLAASGPGAAVYAPRAALEELGRRGEADLVVVAADEGAADDGAAVVRRVREQLAAEGIPVAAAQVLAASRRIVEDHLLMVVGFLMVMAQLAIVVGALGLASTMSLAVLERTRELGVMRALGASHATLHGIVQIEGLVVALLAWAVAVPLSVPLSLLLAERFGRVFLPVAARWMPPLTGVLWWLGVSVVASLLACAWPAWRATRVPTARALAYE